MDERNKCESAEEQDKIDVKHGIVIAIFAIIGGLIAFVSFWLFFRMRNTAWTVGICIADVIFAYINACVFFKDKNWTGIRRFFIPVMMVIFYLIVLVIIIAGAVCLKIAEFTEFFFLYPVFLMPAFVLVCGVLLLFLMMLSYG